MLKNDKILTLRKLCIRYTFTTVGFNGFRKKVTTVPITKFGILYQDITQKNQILSKRALYTSQNVSFLS